ncbi:hypothetical protein HNV08_07375 [Winogradskyella eckloniae]|uniref:hypothetical protein n=1 Tax=Winogradskyella eckloniae TaxID=1089306 RepID=UPI001564DC62|nr:hypothetical protein [Winogradskyella eckloniae]NRD19866.1 hypothetical protein [Winogradskyella eckloniae]
MRLETIHYNKEHKQITTDNIDSPYSLVQKLKLYSVGSKHKKFDNVSPNMHSMMNSGLQYFAWIIPYYHLVIYKINGFSIHTQRKFLHFRANKTFKEIKTFFEKVMDAKVKYNVQHAIPYAL